MVRSTLEGKPNQGGGDSSSEWRVGNSGRRHLHRMRRGSVSAGANRRSLGTKNKGRAIASQYTHCPAQPDRQHNRRLRGAKKNKNKPPLCSDANAVAARPPPSSLPSVGLAPSTTARGGGPTAVPARTHEGGSGEHPPSLRRQRISAKG